MSIEMPANPANPETIFNTAVYGELEVDVAGSADVTLSDLQAQYSCLIFSGVLTGNISVVVPAEDKGYWIENDTTGAYTLTVKASGTTGVDVTQGRRVCLRYSTYATDVVAFTAELVA
jgi:hypothetical protein